MRPYAIPVLHSVARPYPVGREKECSAFIQDMASSGVIGRNDKVTPWYALAFFVAKPGGGLRLVVDFRDINQGTFRMGIPFNSATDIWRQIPDEAAAFLSLDLVSSFFQIHVDERD